MPTYELLSDALHEVEADLLVIGAASPGGGDGEPAPPILGAGSGALGEALEVDLATELAAMRFTGAAGETARVPTRGRAAAPMVLVVGLGEEGGSDPDALRKAGAAVADAAVRLSRVATTLPWAVAGVGAADSAQALAEGIELGAYRFEEFKSQGDGHALETVMLAAPDGTATDGVEEAANRGGTVASAAALVRDLVNLPPGDKRPPALADRVRGSFEGLDVDVRIIEPDELEEGGYGGILGVGAGSAEGPRLVELSYAPDGAERHVALVGKGITFDTGGISLKPSDAMETMKMDMAGAATVAGVVRAAAELQLPVRITGLLALAENMPSGTAIRPSDVLTIYGGKTVEVMNTDAEGRLVLADALVHAKEREPDVIIDLATLTGAALVALGERIGVVMSTDDALADGLIGAGRRSGEPLWRLPVAKDEYREKLDSDVADLKNVGGRNAGTITAGLFLHEFVGDDVPWAHLDIAGVAWSDGKRDYIAKGGTGVPVRTLVDWLRNG